MTTELADLVAGKYLLLTTFRKDGRAVPTAVWFARDESPDGGADDRIGGGADDGTGGDADLVIWTVADSGKVKRIRRDGAVTITACDVRGKPRGTAITAHARLLDAAGSQRTRELVARRYGPLGRLTILGSRIRRGTNGTIGIAITPTEAA
jgi:hypothetical protein